MARGAVSRGRSNKRSPVDSDGVLARWNERVRRSSALTKWTKAATDLSDVGKRVFSNTGKVFWYLSTSFLVLAVPLIIELDREAQLVELEGHQTNVLGAPSQPLGLLRF